MADINVVLAEPYGIKGDVGPQGPQGPEGDSAYEVWLAQGNTGTVDDFIYEIRANETKKLSVEVRTDDPVSPTVGQMWIIDVV